MLLTLQIPWSDKIKNWVSAGRGNLNTCASKKQSVRLQRLSVLHVWTRVCSGTGVHAPTSSIVQQYICHRSYLRLDMLPTLQLNKYILIQGIKQQRERNEYFMSSPSDD